MTDDQHGEGTPQGGGRWDPLPQGDYDDGATAFVQLPEGGIDALLSGDSPLAAPGHGYVPPQITATHTDGAADTWPAPGGGQWPDPNATPAAPQAADDRFTYQPGATQHWTFEEPAAPAAPGHDVTGQWSIPVAGGELPDESGEFTASSLVEQWGGTPPATLPGGAPAPWATDGAGHAWGSPAAEPATDDPTAHTGHTPLPDHTGAHPAGGTPEPYAPETGYGPEAGYGPEGYGAEERYGAEEGYGPADGRAPEEGYGPADGHVPEEGYGPADGHVAEEGYGHGPAGHPENGHVDHVPGTEDAGTPGVTDAPAEPAPSAPSSASPAHRPAETGTAPEAEAHGLAEAPERPADAPAGHEQPADQAAAPEAATTPATAGPTASEHPAHAAASEHPPHPTTPDAPAHPAPSVDPEGSVHPAAPVDPTGSAHPAAPADSAGSPHPSAPEAPAGSVHPSAPEAPAAPADSAPAAHPSAPADTSGTAAPADTPGPAAVTDSAESPAASDPAAGPEAPEGAADASVPDGRSGGEGAGEDPADPASAQEDVSEGAGEDQAAVPLPPHDDHPLASYVLRVNGTDRPVTDAWIGESLLYVLRERLGLAGAKDGCSQGECGACNVQVDGRLVASCLVPAVTAAGSEVRTVEGLAVDGQPSDVQRALARCGAVQCGFCVPGMAMTVHDLLEGNPAPTELETRQALCGNLCRCSGYRGVVEAVKEVVAEREASHADSGTETEEARIPHQAAPGSGGVHPSAFEAPGAFDTPQTPDAYAPQDATPGAYGTPGPYGSPDPYGTPPGPQDQHYGQDGGQA
ncbi:2Fe-2S iron-sulfur cluster-binding protein [Streptomyces tricolor]|uniref:(2Fe-2S)-binding protein n=2 Tax=Streptomyces TaxID=1883 RepID=UPI003D71A016